MGLIWELLVFLNVVFITFLFLTLNVSLFCPQADCLLSLPMSSNCMFCLNYCPCPPSSVLSVLRLSEQHDLFSTQNDFRAKSSHTDFSILLTRTVSHHWQRPRSGLGDSHATSQHLPGTQCHRPNSAVSCYISRPSSPSSWRLFSGPEDGWFFPQIETNLASLELTVLTSCAPIGTKTPASSFQE